MQTEFGGTMMGESAMVNTSDVGSLVEFTFHVSHLRHHYDATRQMVVGVWCFTPLSLSNPGEHEGSAPGGHGNPGRGV